MEAARRSPTTRSDFQAAGEHALAQDRRGAKKVATEMAAGSRQAPQASNGGAE